MDAMKRREPFSLVRMADGEKHLMDLILKNPGSCLLQPGLAGAHPWLTEPWLRKMGLYQIPLDVLQARMNYAVEHATFFCPSPTGLIDPEYDVYDYWNEPDTYGEHFFNITWPDCFKEELFRAAGHVLCIHGNVNTADSMQLRVQSNLGVKVSYLKLNAWTQTNEVIGRALQCTAPLILFSGGPASKMIGPMVAINGDRPGKVVLDIGNQMDRWTFSQLPIDRPKANEFHLEWSKSNVAFV